MAKNNAGDVAFSTYDQELLLELSPLSTEYSFV